jgi:hypothetical protein
MKIEAEFVVYSIVLNEEESKIFNDKLPSEKDIELFIDVISERYSNIEVYDDSYNRIVLAVTVDFEADKNLFSGDTLFNMSIGRIDLPGGDFDTIINSINQIFDIFNQR